MLDPEGNATAVYRGPDASNLELVTEMEYGLDNTLLKTRDRYLDAIPSDTREMTTTFSEDTNARQVITTTYTNGSTRIETYYDDGRLYQVNGSAVRGARHLYTIEQDNNLGYAVQTSKTVLLDKTGTETDGYQKTYTDALGRTYKVEAPASDGGVAITHYYYNTTNHQASFPGRATRQIQYLSKHRYAGPTIDPSFRRHSSISSRTMDQRERRPRECFGRSRW